VARLQRAGWFCLHKLWLLCAVSLVLLATLVTLLRLGLPYATGYKTDIEQFIAAQYGAPVRIGQLSAAWQSTGPALLLQEVAVQSPGGDTLLQVAELRVRLDFWASLTSLQLKADDFELSGLHLTIDSQRLLQQTEQDPVATPDREPLLSALEQLLFQQLKNFTLVDSRLTLQSKFTPPIDMQIRRLAWLNSGERHQGSGEVVIAGVTGNAIAFVLDLTGESLAKSRGQLYLSSNDLNVLPWFETLLPESRKLARADINFQAWGDIAGGTLQQIQIALAENRLMWRQDDQTQQLSLGKGQLFWQPTADGWQLLSSQLTLTSGSQSWHDFQLQLVSQQGVYSGSLQQLQLQAAVPLAQLFAEDSAALRKILSFQTDARITQLGMQLKDKHWFVSGDFIDFNSVPVDDVPGLTGLTGHFSASPDYILLDLQGIDGQLAWGEAFSRATPYQSLQTRIEILQQQGLWRVQIPRLALRHPQIEADAQLVLELGDTPGMTLLGELRKVPVADARHYFPTRHMPESVIKYLTPALISGQVPVARVLWHGAFKDFPYDQQNGIFQAQAFIADTEFSFDPQWPVIKGMQAELLFENAGMLIQSQAGTLFDVALDNGVTARIPDLFQADMLLIDIERQTQAEGVTGLMLASPLSDSVGATLDYLGVSGLVNAKVQLQIGLKETGVRALGDVEFFANQLNIRAPAVAVEQLQGHLQFDNDKIDSDKLSFVSHGVPLHATLHGKQQDSQYQVQLKAHGEQQIDQLLALVSEDWQTLGKGLANFSWDLDIQLPQSGFSYESTALIDLAAAELALPAPFGKTAADGATVLLKSSGNEQASDIEMRYGDQAQLQARLDQQSGKITGALLSLGLPSTELQDGFFIDVNLEQTELLPWISLLQNQLAALEPAEDAVFPALSAVNGRINQLRLFDDVFLHQLNFSLKPDTDSYQLQLAANEAQGDIWFARELQLGGIKADLARLQLIFANQQAAKLAAAELKAQQLLEAEEAQKPDYAALEAEAFAKLTPMPWLADLPPIQVYCKVCRVGDYDLGEVRAKTHSDGISWVIDEFSSTRDGHRWDLTGSWQKDEGLGQTSFSGTLQSPALGQLMQEYDVSRSMSGSKAKVTLEQLGWQGAPFQLNRQTLSGGIAWDLGEGSLVEVSDGGARLFSLFSLDSLVRKLRLDFRDVFAKGFFYNNMRGSMQIDHGVASTTDTKVDGVAGDIEMTGEADLKARQINYQMAFSPKVTSSLPVILAWMVNPVSGVAAYALDEMFQSAEVISKINFSVSGDLDNPTVTELERNSKQVKIPADERPKQVKPPLVGAPAAMEDATKPSPLLPEVPVEGVLAPDRRMPEATPVEDTPVIDPKGVRHD